MIRYREFTPSPSLATFLECFWEVRVDPDPAGRATGAAPIHRVLPDGCMDLIFDLGSIDAGAGTVTSFLVGTQTGPILVPRLPRMHVFGIRFHPGGMPPALVPQAAELTDGRLDSSAMSGSERRGLILDRLESELAEVAGTRARLERIEGWLARLFTEAPADSLALELAAAIRSSGRPMSSAELERMCGLGRRQIERRFARRIGLPPGALGQVVRFRRVVDALQGAGPTPSLSRLALRTGYADQPHMTREFRAFAGSTPGRLVSRSPAGP